LPKQAVHLVEAEEMRQSLRRARGLQVQEWITGEHPLLPEIAAKGP
jgi:hypothetical protein